MARKTRRGSCCKHCLQPELMSEMSESKDTHRGEGRRERSAWPGRGPKTRDGEGWIGVGSGWMIELEWWADSGGREEHLEGLCGAKRLQQQDCLRKGRRERQRLRKRENK